MRRFKVLDGDFSVEDGELTPTSKIRRKAIERLEKASRDELKNWADRVIDADTLEQVFAAS